MPLRVFCSGCGTTLYESFEIEQPREIVNQHNGRCPECGRVLASNPQTIVIKANFASELEPAPGEAATIDIEG